MDQKEVKHEQKGSRGSFYIQNEGRKIATLHYVIEREKVITIEHTVVDPAFEGKGLGRLLVNGAAGFARSEGYKISPVCVYAKRVMERGEEYKDLLV